MGGKTRLSPICSVCSTSMPCGKLASKRSRTFANMPGTYVELLKQAGLLKKPIAKRRPLTSRLVPDTGDVDAIMDNPMDPPDPELEPEPEAPNTPVSTQSEPESDSPLYPGDASRAAPASATPQADQTPPGPSSPVQADAAQPEELPPLPPPLHPRAPSRLESGQ